MDHKNWVDVSDSQSDSNSHSQEQVKIQSPPKETEKSQSTQKWEKPQTIEYSKAKKERRNENDRQQNKRQFKNKDFLNTEALIKEMQSAKQQIKQLSIVYCFHLDEDEIKEKYSMIKTAKKYREGSFEINFLNKDDILKFLKEKQENKDKFFIKLSQPRPPKQPRQYKDHRQYQKPKRNYQQKQRKQSRQYHHQKRQSKIIPNIFDQNKWIFNDKTPVNEIISSINGNNLFDSFDSIRIVVSDQTLFEAADKVSTQVADQLGLTKIKQSRAGKDQLKLTKGEKTKTAINETQQQQHSTKYQNKKYIKRTDYIRQNKIRMIPDMNFQLVVKQITSKNIFDIFGAIRIKSSSALLKSAKELSTHICKQLNCQQIKEQIDQDQYSLVICQRPDKKQSKSHLFDNKIKVSKGITVRKTIEQVKRKLKSIFGSFSSLKVEYPHEMQKQGKEICQQLIKLKLIKTGQQSKKIDNKQVKFITFVQQQQFNTKQQIQKVQEKEKEKETSKTKPKYRQVQHKNLFDIQKSNNLKIESQINPETVISEFQKVRKQFFSFYKCLKVSCSDSTLFQYTRQLGQKLKQQKLKMKETIKTMQGIETLVLQFDEVKIKVEVGQINDYLST